MNATFLLLTFVTCASAFEWGPDVNDHDDYVDPETTTTLTTATIPKKNSTVRSTNAPNKPANCGSNQVYTNPLKSGVPLFCSDVTAYFNGVFHNEYVPDVDWKVQFQAKLHLNGSDHIYGQINQWNETVAPSEAFKLGNHYGEKCTINKTCKFPTDYFIGLFLYSGQGKYTGKDNYYHFLYFDNFKGNKFRLEDTIGKCTRVQAAHGCFVEANQTMHEFCICCGEYSPDPALGCPPNPWSDYKC